MPDLLADTGDILLHALAVPFTGGPLPHGFNGEVAIEAAPFAEREVNICSRRAPTSIMAILKPLVVTNMDLRGMTWPSMRTSPA